MAGGQSWPNHTHTGLHLKPQKRKTLTFTLHYVPVWENTWTTWVSRERVSERHDSKEAEKKQKPCVHLVPEKWWWKQILARRWWKGMSTPSSLTELPLRSPDSSSFAKASLAKQTNKQWQEVRFQSLWNETVKKKKGNRKWRVKNLRD